jgi:hypothetical protein
MLRYIRHIKHVSKLLDKRIITTIPELEKQNNLLKSHPHLNSQHNLFCNTTAVSLCGVSYLMPQIIPIASITTIYATYRFSNTVMINKEILNNEEKIKDLQQIL